MPHVSGTPLRTVRELLLEKVARRLGGPGANPPEWATGSEDELMEIIARTQFCSGGELKALMRLYGVTPLAEPCAPSPPYGEERLLLAEFAEWLEVASRGVKSILRSLQIEPEPEPNPPPLPSRIEALRRIERASLKIALDISYVKCNVPRHLIEAAGGKIPRRPQSEPELPLSESSGR